MMAIICSPMIVLPKVRAHSFIPEARASAEHFENLI